MKWIDAYSTGVPLLDAQHQALFQLSEEFRDALAAGAGLERYQEFLESLLSYAALHFGAEEDCMFRYRCPIGQLNKKAHAGFLHSLHVLQDNLARNGYSPSDVTAVVDLVDSWLVDHIGRIDAQLRPLVDGG